MTRGDVPVVFVEDLVCEYRGFKAVDGVSLAIAQDELFAVLGPNGAGKTTLLETIQGMRAPSAGKVRVFGVDPRDRAASRPRMGIMFQEAGLLGDLTVRETIAAIGMLTGRTDSVDRVLDLIGLRRLAGSRVSQLSGGERRRLDFAVAVYGAPELIFLDEPTTGLDPTAREEVWEQVGLLRRQGATVILTTHYLEEVEQHATRIALMRRGRIVADGTLHDLTSAAPRHIRFRHTGESSGLTNPRSMRAGAWSVITVSDLHSDLSELLSWADSAGVTLDDIQVDSQGLRDYFTNEDGELEHVS